jgi:hypothetical protein
VLALNSKSDQKLALSDKHPDVKLPILLRDRILVNTPVFDKGGSSGET